ncbi:MULTISPECIES: aryldialkylphosphatase [unclassified Nonomuraea]|uniref:phosphotriesterase family protein n=1 Tax=unclassified Nonomuraea TaxID=2593643 RepID=UPI0033DE2E4D
MLRTVTGPVPATAIDGAVLPREHLRTDMRWATGIDSDPYRWLDEDQTVTTELREVRQSDHLGLIIDLTCLGMGRDAAALARIAMGSRVPVIASTGLFAGPFSGPRDTDVETLTRRLMSEISDGLDDIGVFPGVIGQAGCCGTEPSPAEERGLIAAARAALASRLPVATYGHNGLAMLEILLAQGLAGDRVSVGYAGSDPAVARKIAEAGAYVSLGSLSLGTDQSARIALALIEDGHADRLLLSTGVSRIAQVNRYGGPGYAHLFHTLLPRLRESGVTEDTIRLVTRDNPLRWLTSGAA